MSSRTVAGSVPPLRDLFVSSVCRVIGLWEPRLLLGLVGDPRTFCAPCWLCIMPSGTGLPAVEQAGLTSVAGNPLPGTFRGFELNLQSDRLHDLDNDIPNVIGLCAIQPDAAVIKVMSIPDNCCIGVVIPDDHLGTDGL